MKYYSKNLSISKIWVKASIYEKKDLLRIDVREYEKGINCGFKSKGGRKMKDEKKELNLSNRRRVLLAVKNRIQRLAWSNFDVNDKFITLTFSEHITDVQKANLDFKEFIKRLRKKYGFFRYLAVIELMKSGRIHYHMISNLPFIENRAPDRKLEKLWGRGTVTINRMEDCKNIFDYVAKYINKSMKSHLENKKSIVEKLAGNNTYLRSHNLIINKDLVNGEAIEFCRSKNVENIKPVFKLSAENDYVGKMDLIRFDIKNY